MVDLWRPSPRVSDLPRVNVNPTPGSLAGKDVCRYLGLTLPLKIDAHFEQLVASVIRELVLNRKNEEGGARWAARAGLER